MADKPNARLVRHSAVGIELVASIVVFLLIGQWVDGQLGTDPYLTLLGLFLGVFMGFRAVLRVLRDASEEDDG